MVTDRPPRDTILATGFVQSDGLRTFELPTDDRLQVLAQFIEAAMRTESSSAVREACADFLAAAADFYKVAIRWPNHRSRCWQRAHCMCIRMAREPNFLEITTGTRKRLEFGCEPRYGNQ